MLAILLYAHATDGTITFVTFCWAVRAMKAVNKMTRKLKNCETFLKSVRYLNVFINHESTGRKRVDKTSLINLFKDTDFPSTKKIHFVFVYISIHFALIHACIHLYTYTVYLPSWLISCLWILLLPVYLSLSSSRTGNIGMMFSILLFQVA